MSSLLGTGRMVRLVLRRDRVRLPVWVLAQLALVWFTVAAIPRTYPDQRAIDSYAASLGDSPAAVAMSGPSVALNTQAGIVIHEQMFSAVIGMVLMVVFLVVRHTRSEEEEGRTELLLSAVLGRLAGSAAAMIVATLASLLVGAGFVVALVGADVPTHAAVLFGVSSAVIGVVFAAITLCVSQVVTHGRTALGASMAVFGVAYVLRAAGDIRGDWLVWLSPIGWAQATRPLAENERWWPLLVAVLATMALVGVAAALVHHRDVGSGLVAAKPGPARASRALSGPVGLAFRLQRGAIVSWVSGVFVLAFVTGSLTSEVQDMAGENPQLEKYLMSTGQGSLVDSYLATMLAILALVAAGFAVSSAARPDGEEASGRVETLLATGLTRTRWLLGSLLVTLVGSMLVLLAAGAGMGLSDALVTSDLGELGRLVGLQLAYTPAVLLTAAIAVLLFGVAPRLTKLIWAFVVFCAVLSWLGGLLDPPDWVKALSPFEDLPFVPVEDFTFLAPTLVLLLTLLGVVGGVLGLRRRDIVTG